MRRERKAHRGVVKLYGYFDDDGWREQVIEFIAAIVASLPKGTYFSSLNYSPTQKYVPGSFGVSLQGISLSEFETFYLFSSDERQGMYISTPFPVRLSKRIYEICVFRRAEDQAEFDRISEVAAEHLQIVYGYGRVLAENADPASEAEPKRTLFGNTVLKADPAAHNWRDSPTQLMEGGIKGLYPFNVVTNALLHTRLFDLVLAKKSADSVKRIGERLSAVHLEEGDLEYVKQHEPEMLPFVRY